MDYDAQAITYERMIRYLALRGADWSCTEDRLDCSTGSRLQHSIDSAYGYLSALYATSAEMAR
jgi:hypothetical protein